MDLRGDRSRLDAYFAGGRRGKQQRQQQPPVALNAAVPGITPAVQGLKAEPDVAAAAAAAGDAAVEGSPPEAWHHECSPPQHAVPAAYAAPEPASTLARAD